MKELSAWLDDIGLGRYAESFIEQNVGFDLLAELGDADLKELGVAALGDRKRLLKAIAALGSLQATPATTRPSPDSVSREAERRQLTVMFCDLVGSTALATRLDPEDLQSVIRDYHAAVTSAVAPYEGHIAQLLGDGVLVYFGYPRAHEDDAGRAVRAALAVLRAIAALKPQGETALQTRIGIATGLVVVGEIGAGTPAAEHSASGETPNLAARLQAQAEPGQIVLSEQTRRLLGGSFELASLGPLDLKGFAAPVEAWRVLGERSVASRFEAQREREVGAFIGRESEVALLLDRWSLARDGEGQVVLLSGEAGIGKSRIGQTLRERLAGESIATVLLQCSPYFSSSALYPVIQHLERTAGMASADLPAVRAEKLGRLAAELPADSLGCVLRLLGLPDGGRSPAEGTTAQQEKLLTLQSLIELLLALAKQQPVLFLVEDAHWIDPTTDELIGLTVDRVRDARVLALITCRPEYTPSWASPAHLTRLTLNRLGQRQCAALIGALTSGKPLPAEVQAEIIRKTDGIPLFVEELTKTVLQSGLLQDTPAGYRLDGPLPAFAIPSTLQDSLMARLDRLAPAKEVAQAGAVIGREFSHRLLAAVLDLPRERLDASLDELVRSELVFRRGIAPDASYTFKHALIRDTAYNSLLKSQRVLRHGQIAAAIERLTPETAATQPELLAQHHQEAGNTQRAVEQWTKAGKLAMSRGANREGAAAFERALAVLDALPETAQTMSDALDLRIALGPALTGLYSAGAEKTESSYRQALALAERLGCDSSRLFPVLWGLYHVNWQRGRYAEARQAAGRLLEVADRGDDSGQLIEAHHALWTLLVPMGRPLEALVHLEQGGMLYDPDRHAALRYQYGGHDPGACCLTWRSVSSWVLGYPERAVPRVRRDARLRGQAAASDDEHRAYLVSLDPLSARRSCGRGGASRARGPKRRTVWLRAVGQLSGPVRRAGVGHAAGSREARPAAPLRPGECCKSRVQGGDVLRSHRAVRGRRRPGVGAAPPHTHARRKRRHESSRAAPPRRLAAAATRGARSRRGRALLRAGDRGRARAKCQVVRAARGDESCAAVAEPRQTRRSAPPARRHLRLVHRGLRYARPEEREGAAR